jgi:sec-independent protein translocase protein TatA
MMPNIGGPELLLILAVVLIVFGAGKLPDVLGQLGKGVRSFRDEAQNDKPASVSAASTTSGSAASTTAATPGTTIYCRNCGRPNGADSKFCTNCGQAL